MAEPAVRRVVRPIKKFPNAVEQPSLLFLDALGMKKVWATEGRAGAEAAHNRFADLVRRVTRGIDPKEIVQAGIESDAAAILCRSTEAALELGRRLYIEAFTGNAIETERQQRTWLRGSVIAVEDDVAHELRTDELRNGITITKYSDALLEAIEVERSGFRGMRLMVARDLLSRPVRNAFRIEMLEKPFYPFRQLNYSAYPTAIATEYQDFLWMATDKDTLWNRRVQRMSTRMRLAARDNDEIIQAAATQVVFDECTEIIKSLGGLKRTVSS
jgi:hypothetical protein